MWLHPTHCAAQPLKEGLPQRAHVWAAAKGLLGVMLPVLSLQLTIQAALLAAGTVHAPSDAHIAISKADEAKCEEAEAPLACAARLESDQICGFRRAVTMAVDPD
jgi:hypothetical protein